MMGAILCPCCNQPLPSGTPIWYVVSTNLETGERTRGREHLIQEGVALARANGMNRQAEIASVENDEPVQYRYDYEESKVE